MRRYLPPVALAFALLASPASFIAAKAESEPVFPNEEELKSFSERAQDMLRRFTDELAPMVERLQSLIDDISAYEAPEMLPNGDIIIRRKPEAPPASPPQAEDGVAL